MPQLQVHSVRLTRYQSRAPNSLFPRLMPDWLLSRVTRVEVEPVDGTAAVMETVATAAVAMVRQREPSQRWAQRRSQSCDLKPVKARPRLYY
jgi:hypothetical protein